MLNWPDLPLLILDDNGVDEAVRQVTAEARAPIEVAVLLPQVLKLHPEDAEPSLAVVDPILMEPGRLPVSDSLRLAGASGRRRTVIRCILLANGYAPIGLFPDFYYTGKLEGREYWLENMGRLSAAEASEVNRTIIRELERKEIRIWDRITSFRDAVSSAFILGTLPLESPVGMPKPSWDGSWYDTSILWDGRLRGARVPVRISEKKLEELKKVLKVDLEESPAWPSLPFVIVDETERVISERTQNFQAADVGRVILLPEVANYRWRGEKHALALADPIVGRPGETDLAGALAALTRDGQYVRRCIVLAPGYFPGSVFPLFNCIGQHAGRDTILVEMAKPQDSAKALAARQILADLEKKAIEVKGPADIVKAMAAGSLLSPCWLESSTLKRHNEHDLVRSTRIPLWDGYLEGETVPLCISEEGFKVVKDAMGDSPSTSRP